MQVSTKHAILHSVLMVVVEGSDASESKSQESLEQEATRIISAVVKELHEEHKKVDRELLMLSGLAVEVEGICGQDE